MLATFSFLRLLQKENWNHNRRPAIGFLICTILVVFTTYSVGRLAVYGALAYSTLSMPGNFYWRTSDNLTDMGQVYCTDNATTFRVLERGVVYYSYYRSNVVMRGISWLFTPKPTLSRGFFVFAACNTMLGVFVTGLLFASLRLPLDFLRKLPQIVRRLIDP